MGITAAFQAKVDGLKKGLKSRLPKAAMVLKAECLNLLNHQGSSGNHSRPGEPPYRQSGRLRGSVYVRVEDDAIVAGSSTFYAKFLKDRPWLGTAWKNVKSRVIQILKG